MEKSEIEFGKIMDIVYMNDEIYFYINSFEEITFDDHLHAYIINDNCMGRKLLKHSKLPLSTPVQHAVKNDVLYIVPNYLL